MTACVPDVAVGCSAMGVPPEEVSSIANGKDCALSVGDLMGDIGGVVLDVTNIFRGLDSPPSPSRDTASLPDAMLRRGY